MTKDRPWVVVLAGGEARRMGGDKALRPWRGTTLIEATLACLLPQAAGIAVNARPGELAQLGLPLIVDAPDFAGLGPLSGVHSALAYARDRGFERVVTVPCDMPVTPSDMISRLMNVDADVVAFKDAYLCAAWSVSLLPSLETALFGAGKGLAVMRFLDTCAVRWLPGGEGFMNINRLDDLDPTGATS